MSAAGQPPSRATRRGASSLEQPHELVRLVTSLIMAQAGLSAVIGLAYSRRHLPSIIITLMLVAALCGLAVATRSGTHAGWLTAVAFESAFVGFGLVRFITSRYLGGTLLAVIAWGVLLHPAVARVFASPPWRADQCFAEPVLGETSQP